MSGRPLWQKLLFVMVLLVATWACLQVFTLDMALLMAGDVAAYCEIAAAVMFMAARLELAGAMHRARVWCRRFILQP